MAHLENRRVEQAIRSFHDAQASGYDGNLCRAGRWTAWMLLGRFSEAWSESDAIQASGAPDPHSYWDGMPFHNKRVLLRCLHGLGDAIQFIRYAPLIRQQAARLTVESPPELVRILRLVPGVDEVVAWGAAALEWDSEVEVNELPRVFRATAETIPHEIPYIRVPADLSAASPLRASSGRTRAGLIWNSSQWDLSRCVPVAMLQVALDGLNWELRSLQFGPERNAFPAARPAEGDVLDTAADMLNLDLVISVDTMTAHLAGALGRPIWLLLPFEADWRWMLTGDSSPWYPTMRLFRQPAPGDWPGALKQLRDAARAF